MGVEIERKFLVTGTQWRAVEPTFYRQGYLCRDGQWTVRIRVAGETGFLTIKGETVGATRPEFEYPIPIEDARDMLDRCREPIIEKHRYRVEHAGRVWEVDEFHGDNQGLVVAEIELESEQQSIELPDWVGPEVTHDRRYFNSRLSVDPYKNWRQ